VHVTIRMAAQHLALDSFWVEKCRYDDAERQYYEKLSGATLTPLADEVAKARQRLIEIRGNFDDAQTGKGAKQQNAENVIDKDAQKVDTTEVSQSNLDKTIPISSSVTLSDPEPIKCTTDVSSKMETQIVQLLENRIAEFHKILNNIQTEFQKFDTRLTSIESRITGSGDAKPQIAVCPAAPASKKQDDDDDVDLFGSDSEDDEAAAKVREERLAAYNAKKSKKPALIAKSSIILDIKPWDDETDMKVMEAEVRKIEMEGLLWGASKLVPLAYGIHKLQINCVVEDEKVSIDQLQEQIEGIEDYVQSVDIAAFNKI